MIIRDVESLDDMHAVEELQKDVWSIGEREVVPLTQLVAAKETGGQLIGAYDGERLVGFVYGFIGLENGGFVHHSHMLAVSPEHRNQNLGYRLKLAQRERVLAQGIDRMSWTFDPLQSRNAHLNFGKLGAISAAYKINLYGEEHRVETDRLWMTWLLNSERVRSRIASKTIEQERPTAPMLIEVDAQNRPREMDPAAALAAGRGLIEIPADINALQHQQQWREATRRAFQYTISNRFIVHDFFRRARGGVYFLSREDFQ